MNIKEDLVHLSGEKFNKSHKISIKPYWELFKKRKSNKKILWFNQDSFPEISNDISKKYIDLIASSKKSFLFSINQEAYNNDGVDGIQYPLYYLINNNKNFNLENRSRDFLRKGYIEELYKIG